MTKHYFNLKKNIINALLIVGILMAHSTPTLSQINNVWTLGDGEKVFGNDLNHPSKNSNYTWDGDTIRLKGFYNEVLAFQVIVETGENGADNVEIAIDKPVDKRSGKVIGGNTLKYGPDGTIEVFTQHYLNVKENNYTRPAWFYGSEASAPKQMIGWIPDALIPSEAKAGLGGFPLQIGALRNQGFWIDLHLPRNIEDFSNGLYVGAVQVYEKEKMVHEIPLEVTLLPKFLPDENKTNIWLYTSVIYSYFPELSSKEVDEMLKFEGHRHRVDVIGGFLANRSKFNQKMMDDYKPWLDGSAYTSANGYRGPGQGIGERQFIIGMYGSNALGSTKKEMENQSDLWVKWFNDNAPDANYFWYITDEPLQSDYPWVKERAGWVKNNRGVGSSLPIFVTTGYNDELADAIDIWATGTGLDLDGLAHARENGDDYIFYNGYRPRYGSVILEGAAVDLRVNSWILYKYNINTHFIWEGTHWRHNMQGPKAGLHQNIFQEPLTFINFGGEYHYGNGDGILFYPGRMPFYPEEDRGLNALIPSIRLKNIRRGQQDAVLLWMAEQKAGKNRVEEIINKVIPRALSEVNRNEPVPWSEHGDDYDRVRNELIEIILQE